MAATKMKMRIGIAVSAFLCILLLAPESVSGQVDLRRFEYTQVHMGVQARMVLYAPDTSSARAAAVAAFDRIAELDGIMSDYRSGSELMRLCARAGRGAVAVSNDLFHVLSVAQRIAEQSDGAFDVTIGPIVQLWREARRSGELPDTAELEAARNKVGRHLVHLDTERQSVELAVPDMRLDLGGIAKGYAADEALDVLSEHGIDRALIEFGGDVVVSGAPPGSEGWYLTASLASPEKQEVALAHGALSTSGDTEQFVVIDGVRYSHVVDPRTGLGLTSRAAATVVAPDGILSDALSTTLSVLGPEDGLSLISRYYSDVDANVRYIETSEP